MTGYRKLTVAILTLLLGFILALLGRLTPEFATVASIAVGVFAAGNAVEHASKRGRNE